MPKVSIIVPVYNVESFLVECLDSLVNQTIDDIEIIAINDASPDNSIMILQEYARRYPDKVAVIDSPENRCLGGARNLGIEAARGEFIGFVDSDDRVEPYMYERLYNVATQTGADIVDCDFYEFGVDGGREWQSFRKSVVPDDIGELTGADRSCLVLNAGLFHTKLIRRDLFLGRAIRFPEHMFFEDVAIAVMIALAAGVARVPEPLYHYRSNPGSITRSRNSLGVFDRLRGAEMMLSNAEKWGLREAYPNEIHALYIEECYVKALAAIVFSMDHPPVDRLRDMRSNTRARFPDFRKSPYYKRLPLAKRAIVWMNELNPALLVWTSRLVRLLGLEELARSAGRSSRNRRVIGPTSARALRTER